jgi:hypothetical protein
VVIFRLLDAYHSPADAGSINYGLMFLGSDRMVHGYPAIIPFDMQFVTTGIMANRLAIA